MTLVDLFTTIFAVALLLKFAEWLIELGVIIAIHVYRQWRKS